MCLSKLFLGNAHGQASDGIHFIANALEQPCPDRKPPMCRWAWIPTDHDLQTSWKQTKRALSLLVSGLAINRILMNGRGGPHLRLDDMTSCRHALGQPHVSADDGTLPNGDAS